jgi:hypothetical protein
MMDGMDLDHKSDNNCGYQHGWVCASISNFEKELLKIDSKLDYIIENHAKEDDRKEKRLATIENNRNAARNFYIGNAIAALSMIVALYAAVHQKNTHERVENDSQISTSAQHGAFDNNANDIDVHADSSRVVRKRGNE